MNNKNNAPDFLVQWQDDSLQSSLEINCEPTITESASPLKAKLRQGAILHEAKHAVIAVNHKIVRLHYYILPYFLHLSPPLQLTPPPLFVLPKIMI